MDTALHNAYAAKKRLKAELAALENRLRQVEAFIALYDEFAQGFTPDESSAVEVVSGFKIDSGAIPAKKLSIPDSAALILADGYPRTTAVLLNMLESSGVQMGGKNKLINLSSTLSRDSRFLNERNKGWSLISAQKPASPESVGADAGLFSS